MLPPPKASVDGSKNGGAADGCAGLCISDSDVSEYAEEKDPNAGKWPEVGEGWMDSGADRRNSGSGGSSTLPTEEARDMDDVPDAEEVCEGERFNCRGFISSRDDEEIE